MADRPSDTSEPRRFLGTLLAARWAFVVVIVALLAYLSVLQVCRSVRDAKNESVDAARAVGETAIAIAEGLHSGNVTTRFIAAIPRMLSDESLRLELAAFEATETLTRKDERLVFWDSLSLGTNTTEIRVPVTYRYHLVLDDPWHLSITDGICAVQAPSIRPTLPPAIHTDRMEKNSQRGWGRLGIDEQMAELERSVTPTLSQRAHREDNLALVREESRRKVAEFVRSWLLLEEHWRADRLRAIVVYFADEHEPEAILMPTLTLASEPEQLEIPQ